MRKKGQLDFAVEAIEVVKLDIGDREDGLFPGHDLMSPYAWDAEVCVRLLVRVLKNPLGPGDPTGVIYAGQCKDGLDFTMEREPAIAPGPELLRGRRGRGPDRGDRPRAGAAGVLYRRRRQA